MEVVLITCIGQPLPEAFTSFVRPAYTPIAEIAEVLKSFSQEMSCCQTSCTTIIRSYVRNRLESGNIVLRLGDDAVLSEK